MRARPCRSDGGASSARGALAALTATIVSACTGAPDQLRCARDEQCVRGGDDGRCEATGWCSLGDRTCDTGRRYVDDYAGDASGTCVPREVPRWALHLGGVTVDELDQIALGADGTLYAVGRFFDSLLTPAPLDGSGNYDLLLAAVAAATGQVRWLTPIGGALGDASGGLDVRAGVDGPHLYLAGRFSSTLTLLGSELRKGDPAQAFGSFRAELVDLGDAPALVSSAVLYGDGTATPSAVAGSAVVGEWQGGSLDFTAGTPADSVAASGIGAWLAVTSGAGWGVTATMQPSPAAGEVRATAAVLDGASLTVAGRYSGAATFAGAPALPPSLQADGYLATWHWAEPTRAPELTVVRGAGPDAVTALAMGPRGVLAAGLATSAVTIAGVATAPIGPQDALVFGGGGTLAPRRLGAPGASCAATAIAADGDGVVVAGTYDRPLPLPTGELPHRGGRDAFVVRLDASGEVTWARSLGGPGDDVVTSVAVGADGLVLVGATFSDTIELGGGATRTAAGDSDWLLVALRR